MSDIEVHADAASAARAAADAIAAALAEAVARRGRGNFVATGGSTPGPVYDLLTLAAVPWAAVNVTLSDERWVDPRAAESNERLVRERLLVGAAAAARFIPLKTAAPSPAAGALTVEPAIAWLTPFDVTLLGMGEDGHIASLFPGNPALAEGTDPRGTRLVLYAPAGEPAPTQARITLTLAALLQSRLILVLVRGGAKRRIIEQGEARPIHALLAQAHAPVRLIWSP